MIRRARYLLVLFSWLAFPVSVSAKLVDETGLLGDNLKAKTERYLNYVCSQYGVDYWVVLSDVDERDDLSVLASKLYDRYALGRDTQGKGLLFLVDVAHHRVRVEVGHALEAYLTDARANELVKNFFFPQYKRGKLRPAVEATIEYLVDELKKHLPSFA